MAWEVVSEYFVEDNVLLFLLILTDDIVQSRNDELVVCCVKVLFNLKMLDRVVRIGLFQGRKCASCNSVLFARELRLPDAPACPPSCVGVNVDWLI